MWANILNILVLTRKTMITPTNQILLFIALADFLLALDSIPYAFNRLLTTDRFTNSYYTAVYLLIHAHFSQTVHTIAIWLTVILAIWRGYAVCRPHSATSVCTKILARKLVLAVYLICPLLDIPTHFLYSVRVRDSHRNGKQENVTQYMIDFSKDLEENNALWMVSKALFNLILFV